MAQPLDLTQRDRIRDDLKGVLRGECLFDRLSCALYSTDASLFQIEPLGVVAPLDEEDIQALIKYAAERGLCLIPRGAGTGLAGEALGSGLIVDLSRHFRSILEIGSDWVHVQLGVVLAHLNAELTKIGRRFAPNPASGDSCTLGGMIATDASGATALRHGYTRDHVRQIRAVLDNGDAVTLGLQSRFPPSDRPPGRIDDITASIRALLEQRQSVIESYKPQTAFDRCGYHVKSIVTPDHVDLARLAVGSEGTLAIFTEATLRTLPLPVNRAVAVLGFGGLEAAVQAIQESLAFGPAACELMDRRLLTLARSALTDSGELIAADSEAAMIIEFESEEANHAVEAARDLIQHIQLRLRLARSAHLASEAGDIARCWELREAAMPSLYGLRGGRQPQAFIEDAGVPPASLMPFLHRVQEILQKRDITATFLIHGGTGQVHTRPFLDMNQPEDVNKLWALADEFYEVVLDLGGTISSQHGTGLARTPWVARQYGPVYDVFREVKTIFDPRFLFNPGKIVAAETPWPAWPLRHTSPPERFSAATHLNWKESSVAAESGQCNGCGTCRLESAPRRMCPIFRSTHAEEASPRAKANLLRHLLTSDNSSISLSSEEVRAVADLCVNCKMCAQECPAHVNIPKLMLEAKAANVAEHGLDRIDWVMARTEGFARMGSHLAGITNALLQSRTVRWVLEKAFGVSRKRRLPRFAGRNFLRRAHREGWTRKPRSSRPRVALFADVFATYNDPLIGVAAVRVLQHNGFDVFVPPAQIGCGMAPLAYGDLETAAETVAHNIHLLAGVVREGYRIVCCEPTAALMLTADALDLLDDPDAQLVAENTQELMRFLWERRREGRLREDFRPLAISLGHHVPCHIKALGSPAGPDLLSLIPGLQVHKIEKSCSGMAGTFGLQARNYDLSLQAGKPLLDELSRPAVLFGSTECSPCRMQMEHASGKRTLHPVQYLALAYGYLPELMDRLREPIRNLVL